MPEPDDRLRRDSLDNLVSGGQGGRRDPPTGERRRSARTATSRSPSLRTLFYLVMGATLAASCAFMLPVATPPNAVIFGSNMVSMNDMIRAGFRMNLLSVVLIVLYVWWLLPEMWDIKLNTLPANMGAG